MGGQCAVAAGAPIGQGHIGGTLLSSESLMQFRRESSFDSVPSGSFCAGIALVVAEAGVGQRQPVQLAPATVVFGSVQCIWHLVFPGQAPDLTSLLSNLLSHNSSMTDTFRRGVAPSEPGVVEKRSLSGNI